MRRASASSSGPGGRTCDSSTAIPAASDTLRNISSRSGRIRRLMSDKTPFSSTAPPLSLLSLRLSAFPIPLVDLGKLDLDEPFYGRGGQPGGKAQPLGA